MFRNSGKFRITSLLNVTKNWRADVLPRGVTTRTARAVPVPKRTASPDGRELALYSGGGWNMGEGKMILLVQEDLPARKLLSEALHEQGYGVLEAHSGSDAAKVSETHTGPIDLLLADCRMPGMSGLDLVDRLRHTRPDLAVVLLSDSTEETALSHIRGLPFIQKPVAPDALAETIERTLAQSGKDSNVNGAG